MMTRQHIIDCLHESDTDALMAHARVVKESAWGKDVIVRGVIEFSNHCVRNCLYCGLRRDAQDLHRYRMSSDEILQSARSVEQSGLRSVILQSGDDFSYTRQHLQKIIVSIKKTCPSLAITLSIGERPIDDYHAFYDSGADRYLLKYETVNPRLYKMLHPGQSLRKRARLLEQLRLIGYQVGTGSIIGLPLQSIEDIADDLLCAASFKPEMCAIGPFIPQAQTPFAHNSPGDASLTLKTVALARMLLPHALIPSTTALASIDSERGLFNGLRAGANVIMANFTPAGYRSEYRIYDHKKPVDLCEALHTIEQAEGVACLSRGDALGFAMK